jgi:hypothetical protein
MDYKKFSDFPQEGYLEGTKVQIADVIGKEVLFLNFVVMKGKLRTEFIVKVQFSHADGGDLFYFYTGSGVVREQLERLQENLPLWGTLKTHNNTNGVGKYLCLE